MKIRAAGVDIPQGRAEDTVHVEVCKGAVVGGYGPGTRFWTTPIKASQFRKHNAVKVLNPEIMESTKAKIEAEEPTGPKSSDAASSGPSTVTASSNPDGQEKPSSASEVAQVSLESNANESSEQETEENAESSESTTPTNSAEDSTSSTSQTPAGGNGTTTGQRGRRRKH